MSHTSQSPYTARPRPTYFVARIMVWTLICLFVFVQMLRVALDAKHAWGVVVLTTGMIAVAAVYVTAIVLAMRRFKESRSGGGASGAETSITDLPLGKRFGNFLIGIGFLFGCVLILHFTFPRTWSWERLAFSIPFGVVATAATTLVDVTRNWDEKRPNSGD